MVEWLIGIVKYTTSKNTNFKMFIHFNNVNDCLFITLLTTLYKIENNSTLTAVAKYKAIGLKDGLCKFETIRTAEIYLHISQKTTPFSKYFQRHGANIMTS